MKVTDTAGLCCHFFGARSNVFLVKEIILFRVLVFETNQGTLSFCGECFMGKPSSRFSNLIFTQVFSSYGEMV